MDFTIRPMTMNAYPAALKLWRLTPGIGLSDADSPDAIAMYLQRNPGLSQCAWFGDTLVGTVLAGHDGRRGFLHHLCVHQDHWRQGIGSALVSCALDNLAKEGLEKAHVFLFADNVEARKFWERQNWSWRLDIGVMSRSLGNGSANAADNRE